MASLYISNIDDLSKEEYESKVADLERQIENERQEFEEDEKKLCESLLVEYHAMYEKAKTKARHNLEQQLQEKDEIIAELNKELSNFPEKDLSVISISSCEAEDIDESIADLSIGTSTSKMKLVQRYKKLYDEHQEALSNQTDQEEKIKQLEVDLAIKLKQCVDDENTIENLAQVLNNQRLEIIQLMDANDSLNVDLESSIRYRDTIIKDYFEDYNGSPDVN